MSFWKGAAAICINNNNELLMVLQGKPDEEKKWSVPSGGKNDDETFEECCVREVFEETGYKVKVIEKIHQKRGQQLLVEYFMVELIGGEKRIQDPDQLIHEVDWKSIEDIRNLNLAFPEDRELLVGILEKRP